VAYMSPEQLEGEAVDHRTDVFALGTMLYEFASKKHPFKGKSPSSTIGNILKDEPGDLSRWAITAPAGLERVIRRCLRKRREERYQSVRDLAVDIEDIYRSLSGFTQSVPTSEFRLPMSRNVGRGLFLAVQIGYVVLYGAALYHVEAIGLILSDFPFFLPKGACIATILIAAMCGVAVRLYLLSAVGFDHPEAGPKFRRLFPVLLVLDSFWASSPLFLSARIRYGVALGCVALMAYLVFSQRTLIDSIYPQRNTA